MADAEKEAARKIVREAQVEFDKNRDAVRRRRQEAFQQAQASGLSLREIGSEVELHWTTVREIIRGKSA